MRNKVAKAIRRVLQDLPKQDMEIRGDTKRPLYKPVLDKNGNTEYQLYAYAYTMAYPEGSFRRAYRDSKKNK